MPLDRPRSVRPLSTFEKDELLRFFLYTMKADVRRQIMARYPVTYAILFPSVAAGTLAGRVETAITDLPEQEHWASPNLG